LARRDPGRLARYIARLGLGRLWRPASEWWIAAVSLVGWAALLGAEGGGLAGLCSRADWLGRIVAEWRAGVLEERLTACLVMSLAMVAAMMPPLAIDNLRLVAMRSFRWRRAWALGAWLAGYLGTWAAAALTASLTLMAIASPAVRPGLAAAAFLAAAVWQLTPAKRRALRACHRARPLPPTGLRADLACASFGARIGFACIAACGPMMFAAMATPWPTLAMAGVFAVALYERYVGRPPIRVTALAFAAAGGLLAVQAVAL
jgi:hypothetical protein